MAVMLPALWFAVGALNNVAGTSWNEFQLRGAAEPVTPAEQTLLSGVVAALPWNFKIAVAFLSDVCPILGRRRLPYLVFGLLVQGVAWVALGVFGATMSFAALCLQQFLATMGQMVTGVMCDTLIVENIRHEVQVGSLQANTYLAFAVGGLLGTLCSGWLPQYGGLSSRSVFVLTGIGKLSLLLLVPLLREGQTGERASAAQTWAGLWSTVQLLRVTKPLLFIFAFAMVPSSAQPFNAYLLQGSPI